MHTIVLVVSPGRTGTIYIADVLKRGLGNSASVWHERLTLDAEARTAFRLFDPDALTELKQKPVIADLLDDVRATIRTRPYIDTGWTLHSLIPLFIEEFGDAVKLVHQMRHPFDAAASHAVHGAYRPEWTGLAEWERHCFLAPSDNVVHSEVSWDEMSAFEKSLWRHGELMLYWEELYQRFGSRISMNVIMSERAVFSSKEGIKLYLDLLGRGNRLDDVLAQIHASKQNEMHNDWRLDFGLASGEWRRYFNYPWVVRLAGQYGYSSSDDEIKRRGVKYRRPFAPLARIRRRFISEEVCDKDARRNSMEHGSEEVSPVQRRSSEARTTECESRKEW